ncbi:MAG: thioesterase [Proteobacteria bacterium]|nr:thioesterase [Pseudomonadota bacterium]
MANDQNWYLEYKKNSNAALRLFCFHHSGGGASTYHPWIEYLSPHIEMIAIQLPGRENRFTEPLNSDLNYIITQLSKNFDHYKNKPFIVFGHSLGGLLSYEFIKAIYQAYSLYPCHIVVSAAKAPHMPYRRKILSQLDDKLLKEELKAYNGIDESIQNEPELLDLFLPIIRSDFSIIENYSFRGSASFPCDILAFSGIEDHAVNEEEILGWSVYTTGKFKHMPFSGRHFFIKDHQKEIIKIINQIAERYSKLIEWAGFN